MKRFLWTFSAPLLGFLIVFPGSIFLTETWACDESTCVTHHDTIPNFAGHPTIRSVRSGPWSDSQTWNGGTVPGLLEVVLISSGNTVTYDLPDGRVKVVGVEGGGVLTIATDLNTRLTVATLLVLPNGKLEIGTESAPIAPGVTAEVVIADQPIDIFDDGVGTFDPRQYGTGLISVDGTVTIHGTPKTTFARLDVEPSAGNSTLTLKQPVAGWQTGDRLFLPDSKHYAIETMPYVYEGEEMTLGGVSTDGKVLTLTSSLRFHHPGARDGNGVLEFLPHVGNLTRNVVLRSENPQGTRGHVLLTHRAEIDIRYASFRDLGRTTIDPLDNTIIDAQGRVTHIGTNQIGRYPLHIHHVMGPLSTPAIGHQFTLLGNAVEDEADYNRHKWAITIHNSHYGLVKDNVVYNAGGWGIGTEDGNESFNVFEHNLVARVRGEGGRANSEAGLGFWLRGPNNYVRDNSVANCMGNSAEAGRGYDLFFVYLGDIKVPNFKGADVEVAGQYTIRNGNAMPLLEFARNEIYGPTEIGLSIWWLGTEDTNPLDVEESLVRDFRVWNHSRYGYYGYPANRLTFDGFVARGNKDVISNRHEFILGIWFGDYMNKDIVIRNADIQNLRTGIVPPYFMRGRTIIENSYLRNANNIVVVTIGAPGSSPFGPGMPPKETIIRNVKFDTVNGSVGANEQYAIGMSYDLHNGSANLIQRDAVFVNSYNQVSDDDFQVFYKEQAHDFIVPQSSGNLAGSPEAGLTNSQNWAKYGIAIAGTVAPSSQTRPGVYGFINPIGVGPTNLPPTVNAGNDQTIMFPADATLTGTGTDDDLPNPPGRVTTTWSKISGPGSVTFSNASALQTTATFSEAGNYTLGLTATDGEFSAVDSLVVTVDPGVPADPPTIVITSPVNGAIIKSTTLNIIYMRSGDLAGLDHLQAQLDSGPPRILEPSEVTGTYTISGLSAGAHLVRLTLVNESHQVLTSPEAIATVSFTVSIDSANRAPVVNAGPDQTIKFPATANLDGAASDDGLPDPPASVTVTWTKVKGPGTVTFGNPAMVDTTATFSLPGSYDLQLTATDGKLSAKDRIKIRVRK